MAGVFEGRDVHSSPGLFVSARRGRCEPRSYMVDEDPEIGTGRP